MVVDALTSAVGDGRIDAREFGADLKSFLFSGPVLPKRWAARLQEAAGDSVLLAQSVRQMLETALQGDPGAAPRDIHALFELLHELCLETKEAVTEPATRAYLEGFSGSSKAAKLAKKLLALEEGDPKSHRRAAAVEALTQRVARVERWVSRMA